MNEPKYECFDCGVIFSNIPAFGCPCCGSENYYQVSEVEQEEPAIA